MPQELNNHVRGRMLPNVDGIWFASDDGLASEQIESF